MVAMSVGACLGGDEPVESRLQKAEIRSEKKARVSTGRRRVRVLEETVSVKRFSKLLLTAQPGQYLDN